jgi:hypothetical protein
MVTVGAAGAAYTGNGTLLAPHYRVTADPLVAHIVIYPNYRALSIIRPISGLSGIFSQNNRSPGGRQSVTQPQTAGATTDQLVKSSLI